MQTLHVVNHVPLRLFGFALLAVLAVAQACSCGAQPVCGGSKCDTAAPCAQLGCVEHQLCEDTDQGGVCIESCESGYAWGGSACVAMPTGCDACAAENRVCDETSGTPVCADCLPGNFVDGSGSCVPGATCDPAPATHSILDQCNAENRVCVEATPDAAECGACLAGFIQNDEGACEAIQTCQDIATQCAAENRDCVEQPNGHCGECLAGFVEDQATGDCRLPLGCLQVSPTCVGGEVCVESAGGQDAYCSADGCPASSLQGPDGNCYGCPSCSNAANGEDGAYDELTAENKCICRTLPGYYWEEGTFPRVQKCDADGDGWVRLSAKNAMDRKQTAPTSAVAVNARCDLRTVDRFVLVSAERLVPATAGAEIDFVAGGGDAFENTLGAPVALYESDRNDDVAKIQTALDENDTRIAALSAGRAPKPEELNSLTKACVTSRADFNDNGFADVNEFHGNGAPTSAAALEPFVDFAYFVELHDSWFEPPAGGTGPGAYYIREKSRSETAPGLGVPVHPMPREQMVDDGNGGTTTLSFEYWQSCPVFRDPAFDAALSAQPPEDPVGLDFAWVSETNTPELGMNHHSQFRCLVLDQEATGAFPANRKTRTELVDEAWTPNTCVAEAGSAQPSGVDATNPQAPVFTCTPDANLVNSLPDGSVFWAAAEFRDYDGAGNYRGGCVNSCAHFKEQCPGFDAANPNNTQCDGMAADFGKLFCGCGENYAGEGCEIGCPDSDLFLEPGYLTAPRTGYWLCGRPTASVASELSDATSGYTIRGAIPARVTPTAPLCQDANNCECPADAGPCDIGFVIR